MKPFDGGQWVGVTRVGSAEELQARYDESGERLMHLQAAVDDFDVFVRSLSIGAETMSLHFSPTHRCTSGTRCSTTSSRRSSDARS